MTYEDVLCDANLLYKAYEDSIRGSKWKEPTQKIMLKWLNYIFRIEDEIRNRTLTNDPAIEFTLRERGHLRAISSLSTKDRIVRHDLCDNILMPEIIKHVIYDNGSSIKGRGVAFQRKRFEVHLRKYYARYGSEGYILFGDFSKFYDNIIHDIAKDQLLKLFDYDDCLDWLISLILDGFKIDASWMTEVEYETAKYGVFNKIEYRKMRRPTLQNGIYIYKSVNIGDQFSQDLGTYYPHPIDNYIKYVKAQKFYGRFVDDWYIMHPDKSILEELLANITEISGRLGIHINQKKTKIVKICGTYKFLQIKYTFKNDGKVYKRINPERVTAMRRKLKKLSIKVKAFELEYEYVETMFKSWMGAHYKLLSRKQRLGLISLYENLFDCKIEIINKKMVIRFT